MKNWILLLFIIIAFSADAQNIFEVKVNPFLPFATQDFSFAISSEYPIQKNFGGEFTAIFISIANTDEKFSHYHLSGKYYLKPRYGFDNFYVGGFTGFLDRGYVRDGTFGGVLGLKWMMRQNIIIEVGGGLGRTFAFDSYGFIPTYRIYIGYRFNQPKRKKTQNYV